MPLDKSTVRTIDRFGGSFLHTSRTNPGNALLEQLPPFVAARFQASAGATHVDCTPHILEVLQHAGIDVLVPIGGDDTLSYAVRLHREGVPVVAIPKTMDNDVHGTDYAIGFSTAVSRSVDLIHALRTTAGSHERIAVVELFGRNSGETVLISSYLADADRALIAEVPFDPRKLAELAASDRENNPSHYAVIVVSEGASVRDGQILETGRQDAYGHRKLGGIGLDVAESIRQLTGIDVLHQALGYLMRSGPPDSLDRMVAVSYANLAMELVLSGDTGRMVGLRDGNYASVPLETVIEGKRRVDVEELYDAEEYRPRVLHQMGKPMFLY